MKIFFGQIMAHKVKTVIILGIILGGAYFLYTKLNKPAAVVQYVTAKVEVGNLILSLSGTGQVSAQSQVDLKTEASGRVTAVLVTKGQQVKKHDLIAQLDVSDALKSVRDAETNLETAKLSLEKLAQPADNLSVLQSKNSLAQAEENKIQYEADLAKAYEDGFNAVANAFLSLPDILSGLYTILYSSEIADSENSVQSSWNKAALLNTIINQPGSNDRGVMQTNIDKAEDDYLAVKNAYDKNLANYQSASRYADDQVIEDLIKETLNTVRLTADAVKTQANMLDYWVSYRHDHNLKVFGKINTYISNLNSYTSQVNSNLSSVLSQTDAINSTKIKIINADREITVKQQTYEDLLAGADPLDFRAQQLSVEQKENALADVRSNLADYYLRAPMDGQVAELDLQVGDNVSSGSAIGSLISNQRMAEIPLNEIDAAKIKLGQKVTLTFDAVEGLFMTGEVVDLDALGTVSQGVVSYNVKISFDVQDERIKPGMSMTANIILASKSSALMVPSSAIKTLGGSSYVEVMTDGQILRKTVEIGLNNDTMTEITGGLSEGDEVISSTITSTIQSTTSSNSSERRVGGNAGFMMIR